VSFRQLTLVLKSLGCFLMPWLPYQVAIRVPFPSAPQSTESPEFILMIEQMSAQMALGFVLSLLLWPLGCFYFYQLLKVERRDPCRPKGTEL
jgi:hypothetical protein